MKKAITLRLCAVIVISMFTAVFLSYYLQIKSARESMNANSLLRIQQIAQILEKNDEDIERLRENLKEDYFIRAEAAAYIIQNHPEVIGDLAELRKIASLLQVDELHLFNKTGILYAGSEPKYYNYSFNSGEQMQFFLPMLDDYSLKLCQDVTPNTAEGKMMQYIAVWREDHGGIIQIGMEPIRLLEAMEKTELSYIFTMMTAEKGLTAFAVDPVTGKLLGATDRTLAGKCTKDIGLRLNKAPKGEESAVTEIEIGGRKNYCVLQRAGDVLVGVSSTYENLYQNIPANMGLVVFSLCILSIVIIVLILRMLDKIVIHGIYEIIGGMKKIAAGNLDARVEVTNAPEFAELSSNINHMVESLLETTGKLSLVFENVDIPIAVYEYNQDMSRVLATSKIGEILMMEEGEIRQALSNRELFSEKIEQICLRPYAQEKDVYLLSDGDRYVKIKFYQEESSTLGIVVDVTEEIVEKQRIQFERDIDLLTNLSSRRAFFNKMDQLFQQPEELKTVLLLMTDLDNLKYVNDHWGHEYGDRLLKTAAALLGDCEAPNKVAARLSGDEFVLLMYGGDSQEELKRYLDRLYDRIRETVIHMPGQESVQVSLSGGYVLYPEFKGSYREMLRLADQAMYQVKRTTKGHFVKYQPEIGGGG